MKSILHLLKFAKPHFLKIGLGLFLSVASIGTGLIPPYLTMPLTDKILVPYQSQVHALEKTNTPTQAQEQAIRALPQFKVIQEHARKRFKEVPWYLTALAGAAILSWILGWMQGAILAQVSERICAELRNTVFAHIQSLSLEYFGGKRTGDLIAKISTDTQQLCNFLSDRLVDFIADVLMIIGTAVILISINPKLALVTLMPFPFITWMLYQTRDQLSHAFGRSGRAWSHMTNILIDTIPGIRVVKAFVQEKREIKRFADANKRVMETNDKVNRVWTFFWPTITLINQFGLLVVWIFGAWQVYAGRVSVGVLVAFLTYMTRFYTRLESISRMYGASQKANASAKRIFDILKQQPTVVEPADPIYPMHLEGAITLRDVTFRYGRRVVLSDLNLHIAARQMIGLVGHSGAGKSTLINLICRFFDVAEGAILVDGMDIRAYDTTSYRRHIGIVLQEPFLFYGTISDNIAYGKPDADRADIISVARAARAHRFILQTAEGYDSVVSESGQSLSGGERQRISIARALLIDPAILILDEAMASVDTQTEREIQAALENLIRGRTTIAIAHRLSTLRKSDNIIVLDQGHIVEQGTHQALLAIEGGVYANLYQAQVKSASDQIPETLPTVAEQALLDEAPVPSLDNQADSISLTFNDEQGLILTTQAGIAYSVRLVRAYPLTDPDHWISVLDRKGYELFKIDALSALPLALQKVIEQYFKQDDCTPIIEHIIAIDSMSDPLKWLVQTNCGPMIIYIDHEESIRCLPNHKVVLYDNKKMRYLIEDETQLDESSRSLLSRYL